MLWVWIPPEHLFGKRVVSGVVVVLCCIVLLCCLIVITYIYVHVSTLIIITAWVWETLTIHTVELHLTTLHTFHPESPSRWCPRRGRGRESWWEPTWSSVEERTDCWRPREGHSRWPGSERSPPNTQHIHWTYLLTVYGTYVYTYMTLWPGSETYITCHDIVHNIITLMCWWYTCIYM